MGAGKTAFLTTRFAIVGLGLLLCTPGHSTPEGSAREAREVSWLPASAEWISVEVEPEQVDDAISFALSKGYKLQSANIWRVPASLYPALLTHRSVRSIWHMPVVTPPPDEADLPPKTPSFSDLQSWRGPLGVEGAGWWPGGLGDGARVANIEYDIDPLHEDLSNNPPEIIGGEAIELYYYHGNASVGLIAASDDRFGITGAAPLTEVAVVHPIFEDNYDVARAIEVATDALSPGDVILIEQQISTTLGLGPVSAEPGTHAAIRAATAAGIHVVEPAGNGKVDLDAPEFEGWFNADNDPGSIMVGGASGGTDTWNGRSSFGQRVDVFADSDGLHAPSHPDGPTDAYFPNEDPRQAYTGRFGGTSGASAIVAGIVASLSATGKENRNLVIRPEQLRAWLIAAGHAQDPDTAASHPIGVRPDLKRTIETWLTW